MRQRGPGSPVSVPRVVRFEFVIVIVSVLCGRWGFLPLTIEQQNDRLGIARP